MVPSLRRENIPPDTEADEVNPEVNETASLLPNPRYRTRRPFVSWLKSTARIIIPISSLPSYFQHTAFLPSFALSLLYLTVLSFSGQMITYLISVGYSSIQVGAVRTASTIFELSATWIAPRLMRRIGLVRSGIWCLSWQMIWLAAGISWFFSKSNGGGTNNIVSATGLAAGIALSRVGLWGYDLCAQNIIQNVSLTGRSSRVPLTSKACRRSVLTKGEHSRPWKQHSRTCLRCWLMGRLSSSPVRTNLSGQLSLASQLCTPLVASTPPL